MDSIITMVFVNLVLILVLLVKMMLMIVLLALMLIEDQSLNVNVLMDTGMMKLILVTHVKFNVLNVPLLTVTVLFVLLTEL